MTLTKAQLRDLKRINGIGGSHARTGSALSRMGYARAQSTTGIHRGPTIWHITSAGMDALKRLSDGSRSRSPVPLRARTKRKRR